MKQRGTSWVKPSEIYSKVDDVGFVTHWTEDVKGIAKKMLYDYKLAESCLDDFISDGMLALAAVPKEARWNASYVKMAIRNRLITQLHSARTRWSRTEYWGELPVGEEEFDNPLLPVMVAPDGIDNRLSLQACVNALEGDEAKAIALYLAGHTEREIATKLGIDTAAAKALLEAAIVTMRRFTQQY